MQFIGLFVLVEYGKTLYKAGQRSIFEKLPYQISAIELVGNSAAINFCATRS